LANNPLFTQDDEKDNIKAKDTIEYKVAVKYPTKVYHYYKMTEETSVWRQYSDSSVKEYKRQYTMFFTLFPPDPPDDGFVKVSVTFDSLRYKFYEQDKLLYEFDSQSEVMPKSSFFDMTVTTIPNGRSCDFVYSPYGEIAQYGGEDIDWLTDYVLVKGKNVLDTLNKFVWMQGISLDHMAYLADLQKQIFPVKNMKIDSLWTSDFSIELDGINFYDTATVKITDYSLGVFTLEAVVKNLQPINKQARLYGIKSKLADIDAGRGRGSYKVQVSPRGAVSLAEAEFHAEVVPRINKERFKQKIHTKIKWELVGQYKWR